MKTAVLFAALLIAACSVPGTDADPQASDSESVSASPASPSPSAPPPPPALLPEPETLAGEWKIVAIDGKDFNEPYGLALSADAREIWWAPRCAGVVRGYRLNGNRIRIGSALSLGPPPVPGTPPPRICAIGLPARLPEAIRALDAATLLRRTMSNGIELSGGGHSLLLFSQ